MVSGCEKLEKDEDFELFVINKGQHEIQNKKNEYTLDNKLDFMVLFDSSAIYTTTNAENQGDINKLFGFTDCKSAVHENSARFGWNWSGDKLRLYTYSYIKGTRFVKYLTDLTLNTPVHCAIEIKKKMFYFFVDAQLVDSIERSVKEMVGEKFICHPYFGGDEVAPHTINIKLKVL